MWLSKSGQNSRRSVMKNLNRSVLIMLVLVTFSFATLGTAAAREKHFQPKAKAKISQLQRHAKGVARDYQKPRPVARKVKAVNRRPYRRPAPPSKHCHKGHKVPRYLYPALVGAGVGFLAWGLSH